MEYSRSELKAGTMIVVSVVMLMGLIFSIGDFEKLLRPTQEARVVFEDIRGLKLNDPVLYAGVNIGRVVGIDMEPAKEDMSSRVLLTLSLDTSFVLREGANFRIGKTFTGKTSVKIRPGHGARLPKDAVIQGENVPELSDLTAISAPIVEKIDRTLAKVDEILGDEERASIRKFITSLDAFSDALNEVGANLAGLTGEDGRVHQTIGSIRAAADGVAKAIERQQGSVDTLMANLKEASEELKIALGEAQRGAGAASDTFRKASLAMGKVNTIIDVHAGDMHTLVGNLRETSGSLRAWSEDVKRHPWKIVRKGKPDEPEATARVATQDMDRALMRLDRSLERLLTLTSDPNTAVQQQLVEVRQMVSDIKEAVAKVHSSTRRLQPR